MDIVKHGISIGIERIGNQFFLSFNAYGKLTHEDYQKIIPTIEENLKNVDDPHIKAIVDITKLEGWEIQAAWDDLKFGLAHNSEFDKIAIIGNKPWHKVATKVASWFSAGETEYFEDMNSALAWL